MPAPRAEEGDKRLQVGLAPHPRPGIEFQPPARPVGVALFVPRCRRHDLRRKTGRNARAPANGQREVHIVESLHVALLFVEMCEPVAHDLRQRPDEGGRYTALAGRLRRRVD